MAAGLRTVGDGPSIQITAQYWDLNGTRQTLASFHTDDDAYLLIGHIDAGGKLRIVCPEHPSDNGFARRGTTYRTAPFFACFAAEYAYDRRVERGQHSEIPVDSYDGGLGYLFVIASRKPMHFDRVSTAGTWDQYELTGDTPVLDPHADIRELASELVGNTRDAYTISFASYLDAMGHVARRR
jgi:hypothetical protein